MGDQRQDTSLKERVLSGGEGKVDVTAGEMGEVDALNHFSGPAAVDFVAAGAGVRFDGGKQVGDHEGIGEIGAFDLMFSGRGEALPLGRGRGDPGGGAQKMEAAVGIDAIRKADYTTAAIDPGAEAPGVSIGDGAGGEKGGDAAGESEGGGNLIAGDGADGLGGGAGIGASDVAAVVGNASGNGEGIPEEEAHHIEEVGAEHGHIFATGAAVFLAMATDLFDFTDVAGGDEALGFEGIGGTAHLVGDLELDAVALDGLDHGVGIGECNGEGFFHVNVAAGGDGGGEHEEALVGVARADADEKGFFLGEHFAEVGVGAEGTGAGLGSSSAGGVRIGDGDNFQLRKGAPNGVEAMAEVAATGVADNGDREARSCGESKGGSDPSAARH